MIGAWLFGLRLRLRGMAPMVSLDCAKCSSVVGASHLRAKSWSFWAANARLRSLQHQYGWRDGHCPHGHGESTRMEGWTVGPRTPKPRPVEYIKSTAKRSQ